MKILQLISPKLLFIGLLGLHVLVLVTPIVLPLVIICYCLMQLAHICNKIKYGWSASKASGMDVVNGKETDISRPYINIAFRFENKVPDISFFRDRFQEAVLDKRDENGNKIFVKFTKILEKSFGYYVWRDSKNFDIKNHINTFDPKRIKMKYIDDLKRNGDISKLSSLSQDMEDLSDMNWETVMNYMLSEVGARPVGGVGSDWSKWEVLILRESNERYTSLFRYHHSITDGMYFLRLIVECLADVPVQVEIPYMRQTGNKVQRFLSKAVSFMFIPYGLYKALICNDKNPLHGPKLTGKKKFLVSEQISLGQLKEVKAFTKVTINDILFSSISYAVAKHFEKRGVSVGDITALLAVNLQKQNSNLVLKNNFTVTDITLPISKLQNCKTTSSSSKTDVPSTYPPNNTSNDWSNTPALQRLQAVKRNLDLAKMNPSLISISWLLKSISYILPASLAEAVFSTEGITMDISNVKGPLSKATYFGNFSDETAFWLSDRDPLGIAISIISYDGVIRMGLTVDEALIEDDEEGYLLLTNCYQEILNMNAEILMLKQRDEKTSNEFSPFLAKDIP